MSYLWPLTLKIPFEFEYYKHNITCHYLYMLYCRNKYGGTNLNIYYLEGCICSLSLTSTYCNTSDVVTLHSFSFSCSALVSKWGTSGWNGMSMFGVLMNFEAVISSSRNRGIPSVTFISPRPAKWNVLRVIWVDGSPIDWKKIP